MRSAIRNTFCIAIALCMLICLTGCQSSKSKRSDDSGSQASEQVQAQDSDQQADEQQAQADVAGQQESEPTQPAFEPISYISAHNYTIYAENQIKASNIGIKRNKYGESAIEKILYSDEYAGLYCAYWSALETVGTPGDSRFTEAKLRWQIDYTNEDYKNRLIEAYNQGGEEAFKNLYGDIYNQEVFPAVNARWANGE